MLYTIADSKQGGAMSCSTSSVRDQSRPIAANDGRLIFSDHEAVKRYLRENHLRVFERPDVPGEWVAMAIHRKRANQSEVIVIRFFDPAHTHEYVDVIQPDPTSSSPRHKDLYVIYHTCSQFSLTQPQGNTMFDSNSEEHKSLLRSLHVTFPGKDHKAKRDRAKEAAEVFSNFWFNPRDLQLIRRYLGYKPLPQQVIAHIEEVTCACYSWRLSDSQAGMLYQHKAQSTSSVRLAHHIEAQDPFVKLSIDGQSHLPCGTQVLNNSTSAHLSIGMVLQSPLLWEISPCRLEFQFKKFEYERARERMRSLNAAREVVEKRRRRLKLAP